MTRLDSWLHEAMRCLSQDSSARVRTEIQEHYESAREDEIAAGASADEAERLAVAALGDPAAANRQYRKVLLTSAEAKLLREGNWEARAVCSRPWLKALLRAIPVAPLLAATVFLLIGATGLARVLLIMWIALTVVFAAPFLPVYTRPRGLVYRVVKWVALVAALGFALQWSWLLTPCLWPLVWIEWTRISIRRKLPITEWPKQLYL